MIKRTLSQTFLLEVAHHLERDSEGSRRTHGHTYHVKLTITGSIKAETGMIVDVEVLERAIKVVKDKLDHRSLDDCMLFNGRPTTMESLAQVVYGLAWPATLDGGDWPTYQLARVTVWRADGSEATYEETA